MAGSGGRYSRIPSKSRDSRDCCARRRGRLIKPLGVLVDLSVGASGCTLAEARPCGRRRRARMAWVRVSDPIPWFTYIKLVGS